MLPWQQLLPDIAPNLSSSTSWWGEDILKDWWNSIHQFYVQSELQKGGTDILKIFSVAMAYWILAKTFPALDHDGVKTSWKYGEIPFIKFKSKVNCRKAKQRSSKFSKSCYGNTCCWIFPKTFPALDPVGVGVKTFWKYCEIPLRSFMSGVNCRNAGWASSKSSVLLWHIEYWPKYSQL